MNKKTKSVITIVLLSMTLPLLFLIISIVVYEDETPWEGWVYSNESEIHYIDDYHIQKACTDAMEKKRKELGMSSFFCGKLCDPVGPETKVTELNCVEKFRDHQI